MRSDVNNTSRYTREELIDGMMNTFYQYLDDYNLRDIMGIIYDTYIDDECCEESDESEDLDVYFERKMKPMWDYVYNLQKQINKIEMHKPVLIPSVAAPAWQNPPAGRPPYDLDWYKVTCDANGNVPLGGNDASKYTPPTPEQLEEWRNLRFAPQDSVSER